MACGAPYTARFRLRALIATFLAPKAKITPKEGSESTAATFIVGVTNGSFAPHVGR